MGFGVLMGLLVMVSGVAVSQLISGVSTWRQKRLAGSQSRPALGGAHPVAEQGEISLLLDMLGNDDLAASVRRFARADLAWRQVSGGLPTLAKARGEQLIDLMTSSCGRMAETPALVASAEARKHLQESLERVTLLLQGHASDIQSQAVDDFVAELRAADRHSNRT